MTTFQADNGVNQDIITDPTSRTDGDTTQWVYDPISGFLLKKVMPNGNTIAYTYNAWGAVHTKKQFNPSALAKMITTTYTYKQGSGEITQIDHSDGTPFVFYHYNDNGKVDQIKDASGVTDFAYNSYQELEEEVNVRLDNTTDINTLQYHYDTYGRMDSYSFIENGQYQYMEGNQPEEYQYSKNNELQHVGITFDDFSRINQFRLNHNKEFSVTYEEHKNRLSSLTYPDNLIKHLTYDPQKGYLKSMRYVTADALDQPIESHAAQYDSMGRLSQLDAYQYRHSYGEHTSHQDISYNARGEIAQVNYFSDGNYPNCPPAHNDDTFDVYTDYEREEEVDIFHPNTGYRTSAAPLSPMASRELRSAKTTNEEHTPETLPVQASTAITPRLSSTASATPKVYSYLYDNSANRVDSQERGYQIQYQDTNANNQYMTLLDGTRESALSYDSRGNQTTFLSKGGSQWAVKYDANNRPIEFLMTKFSHTMRIIYTYDYLGRRTKKSVYQDNILVGERYFHYKGSLLLNEKKAIIETRGYDKTGKILDTENYAQYFWDPTEPVATRVLARTHNKKGINQQSLTEGPPYTEYYIHDINKNVSSIVYHCIKFIYYSYSPFGDVTPLVEPEPTITPGIYTGRLSTFVYNPFQYSSEYYDKDLALVQYHYRDYNPRMGRWLTPDPIEEEGGTNLYAFVSNDPVNYFDYLGLFSFEDFTDPDYYKKQYNKIGRSWCKRVCGGKDNPVGGEASKFLWEKLNEDSEKEPFEKITNSPVPDDAILITFTGTGEITTGSIIGGKGGKVTETASYNLGKNKFSDSLKVRDANTDNAQGKISLGATISTNIFGGTVSGNLNYNVSTNGKSSFSLGISGSWKF